MSVCKILHTYGIWDVAGRPENGMGGGGGMFRKLHCMSVLGGMDEAGQRMTPSQGEKSIVILVTWRWSIEHFSGNWAAGGTFGNFERGGCGGSLERWEKREMGRFGPFGFAQGRRDDNFGCGAAS
jgi:hypothetical protein